MNLFCLRSISSLWRFYFWEFWVVYCKNIVFCKSGVVKFLEWKWCLNKAWFKVPIFLSLLLEWRKTYIYRIDAFMPSCVWTMCSCYPQKQVSWLEGYMQLNNILCGTDLRRISTNILCRAYCAQIRMQVTLMQ